MQFTAATVQRGFTRPTTQTGLTNRLCSMVIICLEIALNSGMYVSYQLIAFITRNAISTALLANDHICMFAYLLEIRETVCVHGIRVRSQLFKGLKLLSF